MAKKVEKAENAETTEKIEKVVANKNFNDKYNATLYLKGTEFVIDDKTTETTKVSDKQYKITTKRANEFKAKKVVD